MGIYAVPSYMDAHLGASDDSPFGEIDNLPPGHRFDIFFPCWRRENWQKEKNRDLEALKSVTDVGRLGASIRKALVARQKFAAASLGDACLSVEAKTSSPFMTGLGMEHPLENGFAFISPYGIPYLPGSGVKGVLRRAAEDLALGLYGDARGWDMLKVWRLFGFDPSSAHLAGFRECPDEMLAEFTKERKKLYTQSLDAVSSEDARRFLEEMLGPDESKPYADDPRRFLLAIQCDKKLRDSLAWQGALRFWDVFPAVDNLAVEILNPHYGDYYQGNSPPTDCQSPVPVFFLTIPPGVAFLFQVHCIEKNLPDQVKTTWRSLLKTAFDQAFDRVGFGAKTAVGYGRFQPIRFSGITSAAPGSAPPGATGRSPETPSVPRDLEDDRQAAVQDFVKSLPKYHELSGQVDRLLQMVRSFTDEETRRQCCRVLLEHARSDKRRFKEAEKADKTWVAKLKKLCTELGVE